MKPFATVVLPDGSTEKLSLEAVKVGRFFDRMLQDPAQAASLRPWIAALDSARALHDALGKFKVTIPGVQPFDVSRN